MKQKDIQDLTLWDDAYLRVFLYRNPEAARIFVNAALQKEGIHIQKILTQYEMPDLKSHSVIFDALAEDDQGNVYDLEFQKRNDDDFSSRLAYNAAFLIRLTLSKSAPYSSRNKSYVIAYSRFKPANASADKGIYRYTWMETETYDILSGREWIYWLWSEFDHKKESMLWQLFHDMEQKESRNLLIPELRNHTKLLKEQKEGEAIMNELERRDGIKLIVQMVRKMMGNGLSRESIKQYIPDTFLNEKDLEEIFTQAAL